MSVQMNIERQPVIQRGNLTIDPQCCTVSLAGEETEKSGYDPDGYRERI